MNIFKCFILLFLKNDSKKPTLRRLWMLLEEEKRVLVILEIWHIFKFLTKRYNWRFEKVFLKDINDDDWPRPKKRSWNRDFGYFYHHHEISDP
jgi:hypothetical protein